MQENQNFLWPKLSESSVAADEKQAQRLMKWAACNAAPRNFEAALRFILNLVSNFPQYLLYGAGTHSEKLLDACGDDLLLSIIGIVDRNDIKSWRGLPVMSPSRAADCKDIPIIVAHPVFEHAMMTALIDAGVTEDRIFTVYSNSDYHRTAIESLMPKFLLDQEEILSDVSHVIIGSEKWSIISDHELSTVLSPETTVRIHYDPVELYSNNSIYNVLDSHRSVDMIRLILKDIKPKVVYLRTQIMTAPLGSLIRNWLPETCLIQEPYDFVGLFDEGILKQWQDMSAEAIEISLFAEIDMAFRADLVVSKRQSSFWPPGQISQPAPYCYYFGGMPLEPLPLIPHIDNPKNIRILYAGILPRPDQRSAQSMDYNFLNILEMLSEKEGFFIEIYNQMHSHENEDRFFSEYMLKYDNKNIIYNRRIPYNNLLQHAAGFDFGWLYRPSVDILMPDSNLVLGQRFTGYIFAGLPVIIDEGWKAMVELVCDFGAGLVLANTIDVETMSQTLRSADLCALRQGAQKLRSHMINNNMKVLETIRKHTE